MSYTPGPWKWWTSNSFLRLSSEADGKDGGVICPTVSRSDGHPHLIVKREDMALIAAAPDILEALQLMVERFTPGDKDYILFSKRMALAKAKVAIDKATGAAK